MFDILTTIPKLSAIPIINELYYILQYGNNGDRFVFRNNQLDEDEKTVLADIVARFKRGLSEQYIQELNAIFDRVVGFTGIPKSERESVIVDPKISSAVEKVQVSATEVEIEQKDEVARKVTQEDILKYVYEESSEEENLLIEDALLSDISLMQLFLDALEVRELTNRMKSVDSKVDQVSKFDPGYSVHKSYLSLSDKIINQRKRPTN